MRAGQIGDLTMADAILDRVVNNAYKIDLKGPSRRRPETETHTHDDDADAVERRIGRALLG